MKNWTNQRCVFGYLSRCYNAIDGIADKARIMLHIDQIPDIELTSRVQTMLRERVLSDIEAVLFTPPVLWLTRRVFAHAENINRSLGPNPTTEEIAQAVDKYPDSLLTERFVAGLLRLFS